MSLPLELPLRGSRLIEASAGTGKTFTIALLYVRLVLGHGRSEPEPATAYARPLIPPEILVMTFTNAATRELTARIRHRLVEAAACFRADPGACERNMDDPLHALRDSYPTAAWAGCARRLTLAAEWMDEAAVFTIHAWSLRMLQEHAFDSGHLFEQTLLPDPSELLRDAVRDYWRARFQATTPEAMRQIRAAFADPDALERALRTPLSRSDATLRFRGELLEAGELMQVLGAAATAASRAAVLEDRARARWHQDREAIRELLTRHRERLNANSIRSAKDPEAFTAELDALDAWAAGEQPAKDTLVAKLGPPKFKKAKDIEPSHPFFDDVAAWLTAEPEASAASERLRALILADAREQVRERLDRQLSERAELGFDDVLTRLDAALAGPQGARLAARIRRQFPVALIDEFQDTDPVQYRILDRIYRITADESETAIVLIGDPKQAIYSFRGADIHTYLAARRAVGDRHHTLDTNFRSTHAMVGAVNQIFARAEAYERGAFQFRSGDDDPVPFHPVHARGRKETLKLIGAQPPALTAWWLDEPKPLRTANYQAHLAEHAAADICAWLNHARSGFVFSDGDFEPLEPRHIAVLVRNRTEAHYIRSALAERAIQSVYLSDRDSVFETGEARDILRWLEAAAAPEDARLVREALATRTLGLSLAELDALQHDELAWEAEQSRFTGFRRCWAELGVLPMLRRLMHDYGLPQRLLARRDGARSLTDLLHLAEWAQQVSTTLDGEAALIRLLAEHIADPGGEEQILRLESDADLVQVVTIHSSKGLEYPIVVLPFASHWRELSSTHRDALYHDPEQGTQLEIAPKKDAGEAWTAADAERLQEEIRLLYVALTRARHATFIGVGPIAPGNNSRPQLHRGPLGYLLAGGATMDDHDAVRACLETLAEEEPQVDTPRAPLAISDVTIAPAIEPYAPRQPSLPRREALTPTHAPFERWWIASYSALKSVAHGPGEDSAPETARDATRDDEAPAAEALTGAGGLEADTAFDAPPVPGTVHAFPRGPEPGTFLHDLIEWACNRGIGNVLRDPRRAEHVHERCKLRGWASHAEMVDRWLQHLLGSELPLASAAPMRLADLENYRAEQNFWFAVDTAETAALDARVRDGVLAGAERPDLEANMLRGLVTGFIDLVCEHDGRFYVVDWKSNWLGPNDAAYTTERMNAAMLGHRYDVQLVLYLLALHRHLARVLPDYDYDRHVGGGLYVFLRGIGADSRGVLHHRPERAVIEGIDALLRSEPSP